MGIPILRVRDENGNVYAIPAIQGAAGAPGADGITPTIGTNGNWFLGSTDTGKPSRGEKGDKITFEGKHYISLIDGNVYSPVAYPAGWQEQA